MTIDGVGSPGTAVPARRVRRAGRRRLRHRARRAARDGRPRIALAQGLVVGPAIWGVVVNLVMYALPGTRRSGRGLDIRAGAGRRPRMARPETDSPPAARWRRGSPSSALALFWLALASRQTLGEPAPWVYIGLAASNRRKTAIAAEAPG